MSDLDPTLIADHSISKAIRYLVLLQTYYLRPEFSVHRITEVYYTLILLYSLVSVIGLTFNVAVIVALLKYKALKNITNIYILCLALSDIVLCSFNVPMQTYYEISEQVNLSTGNCRILFTSFGIPLYVSCFTILLIALDRYQMIVYPHVKRIGASTALGFIVGVVVFSVVSSIPVSVYTVSDYGGDIRTLSRVTRNFPFPKYCTEIWPSSLLRLMYSTVTFLVLFLVPLVATAGVYIHIYNCLNTKRIFQKKETDRKKRTNKVLSLVVVMFGLCWSPWCIYSLLLEIKGFLDPDSGGELRLLPLICQKIFTSSSVPLGNFSFLLRNISAPINIISTSLPGTPSPSSSIIDGRALKAVDLVLKLVAMGSAIVNPFLYGWLNEPIRTSMLSLLNPCLSVLCWKGHRTLGRRYNYFSWSRQGTFGLTMQRKSTRSELNLDTQSRKKKKEEENESDTFVNKDFEDIPLA